MNQPSGVIDFINVPIFWHEKWDERDNSRIAWRPHHLVENIQILHVTAHFTVPTIRRWTIIPKLFHPLRLTLFLQMLYRHVIPHAVIFGGIDHLTTTHKRVKQLRMFLHQPDAENARPGHPVEVDLFLTEALL